MDQMNTPDNPNDEMTEDEIISMYENLRAAERDPTLPFPFSERSESVNVDWSALEKQALRPSLPEHFRWIFVSLPERTLAYSIVGPAIGLVATYFWLRTVSVGFTRTFAFTIVASVSVLVLLSMWAAVAMQAMQRLREPKRAAVPAANSPEPFQWDPRLLAFASVVMFIAAAAFGLLTLRSYRAADPGVPTASGETEERRAETLDPRAGERDYPAMPTKVVLSRPLHSPEDNEVLKKAASLYDRLMSMSISDPDANIRREALAKETLESLKLAKEIEPGRATISTRLAEIYFLEGDVEKAKAELRDVAGMKDVPPVEERRAQMILSFIAARDISTRFGDTPAPQLARELDATIRDVETAKESGSEAPLLAHLQIARAAVEENAQEKNRLEGEALRSSLEALNEPASALRTVERPERLAPRSLAERPVNGQSEYLVPTSTSGSRPPGNR
jgi:hypothetical protein